MLRFRFLLPALVLIHPSIASAEINTAESVSWIVADSDWIVRGEVTKVWVSERANSTTFDMALVTVNETLKGSRQLKHATFEVRRYGGQAFTAALRDAGTDVVFFLKGEGKPVSNKLGFGMTELSGRRSMGSPLYVPLVDAPETKMYTTDFKILNSGDEMLAAIKESIKRQTMRDKPAKKALEVPSDTEMFNALWSGSSVVLYTAADDE